MWLWKNSIAAQMLSSWLALRPFDLPREFHQILWLLFTFTPKADARVAAGVIRRAVQKQETQCPESVHLIAGDFNHCRLNKALPNYRQYVICKTCGDSTIDLCYGNIPKAYKSRPMPSLGRSVHNLIHLLPLYHQKLKSSKPITRQTKVWSLEATETLNGCFDCMDWDVMLTSASLDEQVETITAYVRFCVEMLIPTKVVKTYPNNKPWVTKGIADVLKRRQEAFRQGSTEDVKQLQKEARKEISENKKKFRHKVEDSFAWNNSRQLWSSLQTMTGYNQNKKSLVADNSWKLAHDLNCFYARFDSTDFLAERAATLAEVNRMEQREEVLTEEEVSRHFRLVSQHSACGPDEIPGAVLKHCHDSLALVNSLCHFSSLNEQDKARLSKITKTASRLIGRPVPDLQAHLEEKAVKCLEAIHCDPTYPLCKELQAHTSARSGRLISFQAKASPFHSTFFPAFVRLCNAWSDLVNWDRPTADRIHVAYNYCSTTVVFIPFFIYFYTYCLNWSNYDFFYLCREKGGSSFY